MEEEKEERKAGRDGAKGEKRGKEDHKGGEKREGEKREMVERKEKARGKTRRNSTYFPQNHSVESTVVVSPPVWSP